MSKLSLVQNISVNTGITQSDVELVLTEAIIQIRNLVNDGKEVRLENFGVFKTRMRAAKVARNLKGKINGKRKKPEPMLLPEKTVAHFKPSKNFLNVA
jgi:nucleoid DNA-binding protein